MNKHTLEPSQNQPKKTRKSKHNMSKTPTHNLWCRVIARCTNPSLKKYKNHGGRGITIYPEWRDSFKKFYDYVSQLENFGRENYTLDRIDNNGNYEPGNVRWATNKQQCRNTRRNILVTFNGQTKCLTEWAEITGISRETLRGRIQRRNWPVEKALTTPVKASK